MGASRVGASVIRAIRRRWHRAGEPGEHLGRGTSKCKGSGVGKSSVCLRSEASVAGVRGGEERGPDKVGARGIEGTR